MSTPRPVLVVDFGAQYAQLIARRVREANVYSEIVPHSMPVAEMLARRPRAIILSGGPSSVYAPGAPQVGVDLFETGAPVHRARPGPGGLDEPRGLRDRGPGGVHGHRADPGYPGRRLRGPDGAPG